MRVALFVVFVSVLTTSSEASNSCMSKTEAREHFASVHIYWHGKDHCWDATPTRRHGRIDTVRQKDHLDTVQQTVQQKLHQPSWHDSMSEMLPDEAPVRTPWVAAQVDIEPPQLSPPQLSMAERWVDISQVAPRRIARKPEPMVTPRGMVMVIIFITLTLAIVMIFEQPRSRRNTPAAG